MGNKRRPKHKKKAHLKNKRTLTSEMREKKTARAQAARENAELQALSAVAPDSSQPFTAESKGGLSTYFKSWVAAATNQPDTEVLISGQVSNPAPILAETQATTSTFKEWIAAQTASSSGNQIPQALSLSIDPAISPASAVPIVSTEPEYIALPEPEISDIVMKVEYDKPSDTIDEADILASCSTSQLINLEIEPLSTETEPLSTETDTKLNEVKVYLTPRIKTRTTKRNISEKTYFDRRPMKPRSLPRSNSTKKLGRPPGTKKQPAAPKTNLLDTRPRGRPRLNKHPPCRCQTRQLQDASTSTEDLITVKVERSESEELKVFFELCDKYLGERTADMAKLEASANSQSEWLIVTEP